MPRKLSEWHGKTDDTPIPPRVKLRIYTACFGRCANCGLPIHGHLTCAYDHRISLINYGENRESNIQLLCSECHKTKTRADVAEKSSVARIRLKHLGIKRRKGKPLPGSRDSGWKKTFSRGWIRR